MKMSLPITILCCLSITIALGQSSNKFVAHLSAEYNNTLYDRTVPNNPWAVGLGFQTFFNNNSKIKATVDLTADVYLEDDKVLRANVLPTGEIIPVADVGGMVNLFAGISCQPTRLMYISFVAGPSFISGKTLFGLKPSLGFYFSQAQKCTFKLYFINVFNRDKPTKQDFGSIGCSFGVKIF
jgi:hypothetical protein